MAKEFVSQDQHRIDRLQTRGEMKEHITDIQKDIAEKSKNIENLAQPKQGESTDCQIDLGVVFVHGIGNQSQGSTLTKWGDPLTKWLVEWLGNYHNGEYELLTRDAVLHTHDGSPARLELLMKADGRPLTWLMTEAWWQGSFEPPSYSEAARWGRRILPAAILRHTARLIHRRRRSAAPDGTRTWASFMDNPAMWARDFLISVGALAMALPVTLLLVLLQLIGLVPIEAVRNAVLAAQRLIIGTLGDSQILIESPMRGSAVTHTVIEGIRYLAERGARKIAIVAHSQGAGVSLRALDNGLIDVSVALLVTVGSGINKLDQIEAGRDKDEKWWHPLAAATLLFILFILAIVITPYALLLFVPVVVFFMGKIDPKKPLGPSVLNARCQCGRWLDLWATKDPVPNGPTMIVPPFELRIESFKVHNWDSLLTDHNGYASSLDDVIPRIGEALLLECNVHQTTDGKKQLKDARVKRENRLWWRSRMILASLGPVLILALFYWDWLYREAQAIANTLSWLQPEALGGAWQTSSTALPVYGAAVVLILATALVIWLLQRMAWSSWNNQCCRDFKWGHKIQEKDWLFLMVFFAPTIVTTIFALAPWLG